ncbi:thymidine kinase [Candidatus Uhrbacteria bacterium]|nr:thymidine kinase [Candidatus Uhrbacteria bacterium]
MAELTVIVGCMFSGKSEELLRLLKRAAIARLSTVVIQPTTDTRTVGRVCSRDGRCVDAVVIRDARAIASTAGLYDVVGIDEAQFFDEHLLTAIRELYAAGKRLIIAGLDTDYRGERFGHMDQIMAIPEARVVKLRAVCMRCGAEATRTFRKSGAGAQVEIGDADKYEALCYDCYHCSNDMAAAVPVDRAAQTTLA